LSAKTSAARARKLSGVSDVNESDVNESDVNESAGMSDTSGAS
jgi:hypothetical protein